MGNSSIRSDANSICLPLEKCKELCLRGKYVNFSAKVLEVARRDLTKSAIDLWIFLSTETVFDSDWSAQISNKCIADQIKRSIRTVSRLLAELARKGYIEKNLQSGRTSVFGIRLPSAIVDDFKNVKPRRKSMDKNGISKSHGTFYFNNINNNSAAKYSNNTHTLTNASPIVVDREKLEKLEEEFEKADHHFTELCKKRQFDKSITFEKIDKAGQRRSNIYTEIMRLRKPKKVSAKDHINSIGSRPLKDSDKAKLFKVSPVIAQQIAFAVRRGDLGGDSVSRGVSAGLKLYREQRWEMPKGMMQ